LNPVNLLLCVFVIQVRQKSYGLGPEHSIFKKPFHLESKNEAAQLFSTLIIINVTWALNQHIIIIYKRSCDIEDWSNDAENAALHHMNE